MRRTILRVRNLKTYFFVDEGIIKAVDDVSFDVFESSIFGLVGESGCGKSVTALSILRLIQDPPGRIIQGEVIFKDKDLLKIQAREMRKVRGGEISMIFQEPTSSLNPVFTIGSQIQEAIQLHQNMKKEDAHKKAIEMLKLVGMPDPEERLNAYPHQLSGGMNQRAMIAMALACNPSLLIADEPTTALDVTIEAQILDLLRALQQRLRLSIIIITHDLGIIAQLTNYVAVMYAGKVVEYGSTREIFKNPAHPYTLGLLESIPRIDQVKQGKRLPTIQGTVPDPANLPSGCAFHPRCFMCSRPCQYNHPEMTQVSNDHWVACFTAEK